MRFLMHASLAPEVADALRELGHATATPAALGLDDGASPATVLQACRVRQHELVVASGEFVEAALPDSGRRATFGRVLVFLHETPAEHALAVHRLFERYKRLAPGRLYTVTAGRVKVRQLPTGTTAAL